MKNGLSTPASHDTTNKKKNIAPSTAVKKPKLNWDDDFEDQSFDSGLGNIESWQKNKPAKVEQQLIDLKENGVQVYALQMKVDVLLVTTSVSKAPLLIIDQLGKDWKDLLCYNYELRTTLHLKREDLQPKATVDACVTFLQNLKR